MVKHSVKNYVMTMSGQCSIAGDILSQYSFSAFMRKRNLSSVSIKVISMGTALFPSMARLAGVVHAYVDHQLVKSNKITSFN